LQDETGTKVSPDHIVTLSDPIPDPTDLTLVRDHASVSLSLIADAPTNTEQTYFLAAQANADRTTNLRAWGELTATTYPFAN
ncbi:MAG: hypothetical protein H0U26_04105, partial [Acidimicrobiia bacterium]|nr:hypothetical protein [Acidimicrobiia bacterium]